MENCVIITGGAGFIGSNLVKRLLSMGFSTIIIDNFSTGKKENLAEVESNKFCYIYDFDITDGFNEFLTELCNKHCNINGVFHLAAQVSVQKSMENPKLDAIQNFYPVYDLIKFLSSNFNINFLSFASSAADLPGLNRSS